MDSRIPASVQAIVEKYLTCGEQLAPGLISAFYIVGSIALDGYNERFSDVDFISVLAHPASASDLDSLRAVHRTVEDEFPNSKLSGSYLQKNELGRSQNQVQPHPYFQDGRLHEKGYFELNPVTWWVLKNHGITVRGDAARDLPITIDWYVLITEMRQNMNSYWLGWTKSPRAFLILLSDWGIQWTVLGVLRQYYTFRENSITTKVNAGKYALSCLPAEWHPLVRETIAIRAGNTTHYYRSRIGRMFEAVKFLRYVIQVSQ